MKNFGDVIREMAMGGAGYPQWICYECGKKHGKRIPSVATYHMGDKCGWCGRFVSVTEPRDFGYPKAPGDE